MTAICVRVTLNAPANTVYNFAPRVPGGLTYAHCCDESTLWLGSQMLAGLLPTATAPPVISPMGSSPSRFPRLQGGINNL